MGRWSHVALVALALFATGYAAGEAAQPPPVWTDEGAGRYTLTSRVAACPQEGAAAFRYVADEVRGRFAFRIDRAGQLSDRCFGPTVSAWEGEFNADIARTGAVLDHRNALCYGFVITIPPFALEPTFEVRMRYTPDCASAGLLWLHTFAHVPPGHVVDE